MTDEGRNFVKKRNKKINKPAKLGKESYADHWLYRSLKSIDSEPDLIKAHVREAKITLGRSGKNKHCVADYLIKKKTDVNTALGAATGAVGIVPVIGGIGAVATTVTAEFITMTHQEIELCFEIAENYGYPISRDERLFEILAIIGEKKAIKDAGSLTKLATRKVIEKLSGRYARVGLLKGLRRVALRLELKLGLKAFTRFVPLLGIGFGALINYKILKNTGSIAKKFYGHKLPA